MQIDFTHEQDPREVPLPFLGQSTGLGEWIARGLAALGVPQCGGCKDRADALDRVARFVPWDE